jgi:hypothetical protein
VNEVEGALGTADGETTSDLSARLTTALQWAAAWQLAGYKGRLLERINLMIGRLSKARDTTERLAPFLNAAAVRDYNAMSRDWAQLYRDVALSPDLLPQYPAELSQIMDALAAAGRAAESVGDYVLGALGLYALAQLAKSMR